jgi:hypothetical protein
MGVIGLQQDQSALPEQGHKQRLLVEGRRIYIRKRAVGVVRELWARIELGVLR